MCMRALGSRRTLRAAAAGPNPDPKPQAFRAEPFLSQQILRCGQAKDVLDGILKVKYVWLLRHECMR
jgi:hypothetical protein